MRTLAVGDIHGCLKSIETLMNCVGLGPNDRLILLGDMVDCGLNTKGVIDWILEKRKSIEIITLGGNHEEMMLAAASDDSQVRTWKEVGGLETLISYDADSSGDWTTRIPKSHWNLLQLTKLYFETPTHIYVHGAIDHERAMKDQDHEWLLWQTCEQMKPHVSGRKVICGHTAHKNGNIGVYDFGYCIDTDACRGQWLTCLEPETGEFWQANEKEESRTGRLYAGR